MKLPVYLDNHATTPLDPEVFEAMKPYFLEKYGNASSAHTFGYEADAAVKLSRKTIADFLGGSPSEIIFTSGTTESINLVHFGIAQAYYNKGKRVITSAIEHPASMDSLKILEEKGYEIIKLGVNIDGLINLEELQQSINNQTILVSIIAANNEIGVIQDLEAIGNICDDKNVLFHTDAAQAAGKIPINPDKMNIDLISFSAHKLYGPKGIGALFIKDNNPKIKLIPQLHGGGQEKGLRSGTLNIPGIVGFAKAIQLCSQLMNEENERIKGLRDQLYDSITSGLEDVNLNGSFENRLPNNLSLSFEGVKSETFLTSLREIAVSSGSACASQSLKPSHVLKAIGLSDEQARSTIRFGLGRFTTEEEVEFAAARVVEAVKNLRKSSPLYKALNESIIN